MVGCMYKNNKTLMRSALLFAMALQSICATSALAATQNEAFIDLTTPTVPLLLEDLIDVDDLGFDCIREELIDVAFHASGKGVRMPRTCLPEPCVKALVPEELALLIGRQPEEEEWGQYFSRYADVCRKEVVPFNTTDLEPPADSDNAIENFWAPLIETFIKDRELPRKQLLTDTVDHPYFPPLKRPVFVPTKPITFPPFGPGPNPDSGSTLPSPVPLPAAFWMLLAGLMCFAPWKWRQTRTS